MNARCLCIALLVGCSRAESVLPPRTTASPRGEHATATDHPAPGQPGTEADPDSTHSTDWTAAPWTPRAQPRDWKFVVVHHTASRGGNVESIHEAHLQRTDASGRPWQGIGYHFVIGNGNGMEEGAVEPTFRWRDQLPGAHAGVAEYNQEGIGICLVGNFQEHPPSTAQMEALRELVAVLTSRYGIHGENIVRHQDVKPTVCPGRYFPWEDLQAAGGAGRRVVHLSPPEPDGTR